MEGANSVAAEVDYTPRHTCYEVRNVRQLLASPLLLLTEHHSDSGYTRLIPLHSWVPRIPKVGLGFASSHIHLSHLNLPSGIQISLQTESANCSDLVPAWDTETLASGASHAPQCIQLHTFCSVRQARRCSTYSGKVGMHRYARWGRSSSGTPVSHSFPPSLRDIALTTLPMGLDNADIRTGFQ